MISLTMTWLPTNSSVKWESAWTRCRFLSATFVLPQLPYNVPAKAKWRLLLTTWVSSASIFVCSNAISDFYTLYINNMHFADIINRCIYLLWTVKSNNFTVVGWKLAVSKLIYCVDAEERLHLHSCFSRVDTWIDPWSVFQQDLIERDLPKFVQLLKALTEQVRTL